jgi:hypothetical protein
MLFTILYKLLSFGIDKYADYKSTKATTGVELEKIKADVEKNKDTIRGAVLMNGSWWFQLFFIIPLSIWFSSVVLYSVFLCQGCMFPQPWSIAALPKPLDEWAGWIVGFLFLVTPVGKK